MYSYRPAAATAQMVNQAEKEDVNGHGMILTAHCMTHMFSGLEQLDAALDELNRRLIPVLKVFPPTGTMDEAAAPESGPPFSPLSEQMANANGCISDITHRIQDILSRLDV